MSLFYVYVLPSFFFFFFFNDTATTEIYTLSLHDALPISGTHGKSTTTALVWSALRAGNVDASLICGAVLRGLGSKDRKSTRLNSSHSQISYAVFCLKKKKKKHSTSDRHKQLTTTAERQM